MALKLPPIMTAHKRNENRSDGNRTEKTTRIDG